MYIVIETARDIGLEKDQEFIHFIDEDKDKITNEFLIFLKHWTNYPGQQIKKVYRCKDRLTEW